MTPFVRASLFVLLVYHTAALAGSAIVTTCGELDLALSNAAPHDTILLASGVYEIEAATELPTVTADSLTIRSVAGVPDSATVRGQGMFSGPEFGFRVLGSGVTIADITIEEVARHCIWTGADGLTVRNCVLRNAGEQLVTADGPQPSGYTDSGTVEDCVLEFTTFVAPDGSTGGIACHRARDWVIRHCVFGNIASPDLGPAGYAVHVLDESSGTLVEGNLIRNCDRGIMFGLLPTSSHQGGIVRNNMITAMHGPAVAVYTAPDVRVYNNTAFVHDSHCAMEYRFATTINAYFTNNLCNLAILARDGATGTDTGNVTTADAAWFVDTALGDLHLASDLIDAAIDRGILGTGLSSDFDGDTRPYGAGIDVGADEYVPAVAVGSPAFVRAVPHPSTSAGRWFTLSGRRVVAGRIMADNQRWQKAQRLFRLANGRTTRPLQ